MPKITFRDKEYNSLADMPAKVRHDYFKARAGYDVSEKPRSKTRTTPGGMENMPAEVREIFERVRGKLDEKPIKTSPVDDLPKTEDLYQRSAPKEMQNQPSDEVIYRPSPPLIEPPQPIAKSEDTVRRLVFSLLFAALAVGIAMAVMLTIQMNILQG
jgi:hypothetical protein